MIPALLMKIGVHIDQVDDGMRQNKGAALAVVQPK